MSSRNATVPEGSDHAQAAQVVVSDVFVSPRVVDRRAYAELAGELRELIAQAAHERLALVAGMDQAGRASDDFRAREAAQAVNLDLCAKAIKRIDERAAKVESVLAQASDVGKLIATIEEKTGRILESKIQAMEARAAAIQAAATAHTQALEERLKRATRELEQRIEAIRRDAESIVSPSAERLTALCDRAARIVGREPGEPGGGGGSVADGSMLGLILRAEALAEKTAGAIDHMDRVRVQAEGEKTELDAWIAASRTRLDEVHARWKQIEAMSGELAGRSHASAEELRVKLELTAAVVRQSLDQAVSAAQGAGEQAVAKIRLEAERALGQTQALLTQLEDRVAGSRLEAAELSRSIEQRTASMRTSVEASLLEVKPQADAALADLREAVRQSHAAHNTTGLALKLLEKASGSAGEMLERLRPWEGVLTGATAGDLPGPVRKIIENVKREMQADLSSIASALRVAAARAERATEAIGDDAPTRPDASPEVIVRKRVEMAQSAD
jgi:hypothetical protein